MDHGAVAAAASPDVLVVVDPDGRVAWASPSARPVLGLDPAAEVGRDVLALVHPDDLGYAAGMLAEALAEDGPHAPPVLRVRRGDGSWATVEVAVADAPAGGLVLSARPTEARGLLPDRRTSLDRLLHATAARCAGASGSDLGLAIDEALQQLAAAHGATAAAVVELDRAAGLARPRRWWSAGFDPLAGLAAPLASLPWDPDEAVDRGYVEAGDPLGRPAGPLLAGAAAVLVDVPVPVAATGPADGFVRLRFEGLEAARAWDEGNVGAVVALGRLLLVAEARRRAEAELAVRAETDPLTGLANRHRLERSLQRLLDEPAPAAAAAEACLLYCDLDGFKAVNDALGHAGGDRVLVAVADAVRAAVRDEDLVARVGGDELVVLCRRLDGTPPAALAERVRAAVAGVEVDGPGPVGVSIGVVPVAGATGVADLLQRADAAMYRAKRAPRRADG